MAQNRPKIKWAFMVSGWGRTAVNALELFEKSTFNFSEVSLLIYDETPCGAFDKSKEMGIDAIQISRKNFENSTLHQKQLLKVLNEYQIDFVFMLAYKYKIKKELLNVFQNRILNIHPSLFPSFLGTQTAIQDALDYGVKITGITTHIIDEEYDKGIILAQEPIRINDTDNFDSLYMKFIEKGKKVIKDTILLTEQSYNSKW